MINDDLVNNDACQLISALSLLFRQLRRFSFNKVSNIEHKIRHDLRGVGLEFLSSVYNGY